MGLERKKTADGELKRLLLALNENEKLMHEAALKYEDLVAAKEDLTAAVEALKEQAKKGAAR